MLRLWCTGQSSQARMMWRVLAMCSSCDTIPIDRSIIEFPLSKRQSVGSSDVNARDRISKNRALSLIVSIPRAANKMISLMSRWTCSVAMRMLRQGNNSTQTRRKVIGTESIPELRACRSTLSTLHSVSSFHFTYTAYIFALVLSAWSIGHDNDSSTRVEDLHQALAEYIAYRAPSNLKRGLPRLRKQPTVKAWMHLILAGACYASCISTSFEDPRHRST